MLGGVLLIFEFFYDECGVDSEHAEGVVEDNFHFVNLEWLIYDQIWKCALRVEVVDVDRWVNDVVLKGGKIACQFERAGGTHAVADIALGVVDVSLRTVAEDFFDRFALLNVAHGRGSGVGVHEIHVFGLHASDLEGGAHAFGLAHRIRKHVIACVGVDPVADDFGNDVGTACLGVFEALKRVDAATFGDDDPVTGLVEGAAGFVGIAFVGAEGALALEAGEDSERLDTLTHATGECEVDLAEAKHLQRLDKTGVPCGACGTDSIVRSGNPHVDGDLACRVVGDGARIVVVRPKAGVVVELRDVVDLVLGLDITVLGGADIDADAALIEMFEVDPAVIDRFVRCIDRDAAGTGADTQLLAGLVFLRVEVADTGRDIAHVAHIDDLNTSDPIEEILSIFFESVAVWRGETDACDDYTRLVHE